MLLDDRVIDKEVMLLKLYICTTDGVIDEEKYEWHWWVSMKINNKYNNIVNPLPVLVMLVYAVLSLPNLLDTCTDIDHVDLRINDWTLTLIDISVLGVVLSISSSVTLIWDELRGCWQ